MIRTGAESFKSKKRWYSSTLPNLIFTLLICVACWYIGYNYWLGFPIKTGSGTSILWNAICGFLTDKDYAYLAGFILLMLAAILLQLFNFRFVFFRGKTILPFLLFLLFNSLNPVFFPVRPVSIAIFLIIFAMFELFGSYQNPIASGRMFNMMFYICVGSLFWPYLLWFIPVFWIGMYQFRILNVRTFTATLIGLFTFFWFMLGWCIWKHDWSVLINMVQCLSDIHIVFTGESWLTKWARPLCFFFFMIFLLFYISSQDTESSIRTRHFLSFLFSFGFFSFFLSLFYAFTFVDFECVCYLSASLIASYAFSKKYGIASLLLYYLIVAGLIILLFVSLWNIL